MRHSMLANTGSRSANKVSTCATRCGVARRLLFLYPAVDESCRAAAGRRRRNRPSSIRCCGKRPRAGDKKTAQRVIVRTRKGRASAVADRLEKHGDRVERSMGASMP